MPTIPYTHRICCGIEMLESSRCPRCRSTGKFKPRWRKGDRVTRKVYLDDGTWATLGDKCLPKSPLKHGTIIQINHNKRRDCVLVQFDDGTTAPYLTHGIQREKTSPDSSQNLPYKLRRRRKR